MYLYMQYVRESVGMYVCIMYVSITIDITLLFLPIYKITLVVKDMHARLQKLPIL